MKLLGPGKKSSALTEVSCSKNSSIKAQEDERETKSCRAELCHGDLGVYPTVRDEGGLRPKKRGEGSDT